MQFCIDTAKKLYGDELYENPVLRRNIKIWEEKIEMPDEELVDVHQKEKFIQFLELQRKFLLKKNLEDRSLNEDLVRHHLHLIDPEEERIKRL